MAEFIEAANNIIWSKPLIYLCLLAGVYFTIRTRLLQIRQIPAMIRSTFKGESSADGVSSFQALAMSLAGRVGTGNIAGVATAIAFGGPGAVFWMWLVAFLGSSTSFIESTLGQIYKERDKVTGEYRGGPAYYFEKAYRHTKYSGLFKVYASLFAFATVLACGFFLPGVQANGIAAGLENAFPAVHSWMSAVGITVVLAFIVIGGVKRIANFASVVVPVMAIVYIIAAIIILFINIDQVGSIFALIFESAFGLHATFGAIIGSAIEWGVKRGIYSNEAGQGTGPHSAAAAEVKHPASQGFVQAMAVYIDTLFVCSATAFLILSTGMYRVYEGGSDKTPILAEGSGSLSPDAAVGPAFAQAGFDTFIAGAGPAFIAISLTFFAFTTIVAYYYMAETNLRYLTRNIQNRAINKVLLRLLQLAIIVASVYGCISTAGAAWALGDIGVGLMAWLNIVGILVIQKPALLVLKDYEKQHKQGLDPIFDPRELGIKNADFWERYYDTQTGIIDFEKLTGQRKA
ncbi:MAG: alanine/glycine:cation symporter family protein [Rothia sp. (in: high G+C Gram-positive bacteria)]|nr:alanine/glycine:cation symporter family protein [Rothia sp. (in: high G+C Gram-positive bacteria)]